MTDKFKLFVFLLGVSLIAAVIFVFLGGLIGYQRGFHKGQALCQSNDTIYIDRTDTVTLTLPPDTIRKVIYKTKKVPLIMTETDTIVDSVLVSLPYEQHFARLDTVADVWYSGYDAKIDSARIYRHHTTQVINHTKEVKTMPRFSINLGIGGMQIEKFRGFAGGEATYHAKSSDWGIFGGYSSDFNGENLPYFGGKVSLRIDIK